MIDIDKDYEPFLIEFSDLISAGPLNGETRITEVNDETTDDD